MAHSEETPEQTYKDQLRMLEDLQHQLKTPVLQAYAIASRVTFHDRDIEVLRREVRRIQSLCGKARQIILRSELLAEILRGSPIGLRVAALTPESLARLLIDVAQDAEVMVSDRQIAFFIDMASFTCLAGQSLVVDRDMFEQALRNVVDNAGKYSYTGTRVYIGAEQYLDWFAIVIKNKGIPLRCDDIQKSLGRGWRSELAKSVTGEGSGIGLWLADRIMQAHGGQILISPTDDDELTTVKLSFKLRED